MFNEKHSWLNVNKAETLLKIVKCKADLDAALSNLDSVYLNDGYPLESAMNSLIIRADTFLHLVEKLRIWEEILAA